MVFGDIPFREERKIVKGKLKISKPNTPHTRYHHYSLPSPSDRFYISFFFHRTLKSSLVDAMHETKDRPTIEQIMP